MTIEAQGWIAGLVVALWADDGLRARGDGRS